MSDRNAIFLYCDDLDRYPYPDESPFKTQRVKLTRDTVASMGLLNDSAHTEARPVKATRAELETFHTAAYLDALARAEAGDLDVNGLAMGLGTPDCPVFRGMVDYAEWACGASLTGARHLLSGDADVAFNASGGLHHAGPDYAAGFCYMNDIVLASLQLAEAGKRVLCLDLDVHHGDGTQNAFYSRNDIMTISMHESGKTLFPGTGFENEIGEGEGRGYCVNVPLPVGTYDEAYEAAFRQAVYPLMKAFDADVIVVELGMDGLSGDPLAHLHLTNNVYADIIGIITRLGSPILATGGGGYHVDHTVRGWALAWSVLCGQEQHDLSLGMGGVMMETTEWSGGLRDRALLSEAGQRGVVDAEIQRVIEAIKNTVFPVHGL